MEAQLANLMGMAATAELGGNREEAISYYNRVLEADPKCSAAWLGKGKNSGQSSSIEKMRVREAVVHFGHAIAAATDDAKDTVARQSYAELLAMTQVLSALANRVAQDRGLRAFALSALYVMVDCLHGAEGWDPGNRTGLEQIVRMSKQALDIGLTGEESTRLQVYGGSQYEADSARSFISGTGVGDHDGLTAGTKQGRMECSRLCRSVLDVSDSNYRRGGRPLRPEGRDVRRVDRRL